MAYFCLEHPDSAKNQCLSITYHAARPASGKRPGAY